jgi:hypothetical protein
MKNAYSSNARAAMETYNLHIESDLLAAVARC